MRGNKDGCLNSSEDARSLVARAISVSYLPSAFSGYGLCFDSGDYIKGKQDNWTLPMAFPLLGFGLIPN
jgi:hypothetical protein